MIKRQNLGLIIFFALIFSYNFIKRQVQEKYEIYLFCILFLIGFGLILFDLYNIRKSDKINGTNLFTKTVKERVMSMLLISIILISFYYFTKQETLPLP